MRLELEELITALKNKSVERPNNSSLGTLSGHAAGEPFEKLVYQYLKAKDRQHIFKQYEYLNDLYLRNPQHISVSQKKELFESPTAFFLLSRGDDATQRWSATHIFEEKQNDTADILYANNGEFHIIDVKTKNLSKNAQAPNIISAAKLAKTCALILDNKEFDSIWISYIEIGWREHDNQLTCQTVHLAHLFNAKPETLYINWAAAMQIQFHVSELDQTWNGDMKAWAKSYLKVFVNSAKQRAKTMIDKFVTPYLKYLED